MNAYSPPCKPWRFHPSAAPHTIIFLPLRGLHPNPSPPHSPKTPDRAPHPRNHPPHRRQRRQDAGSKRTPTQYRQPCAPAQNTRHGRKWCTKHLSYLPVIESQRQNPCCRTLAFTCADARCPSSPGSHDFGPPAPASWYNGSPKNPPARRPAVPSIRRERPSPNQNPWPSLFTQPRPTAPPLRTPTTKPHLVSRITDFSTYPPHNALPQTRQNEHHSLLPEPPGSCAPHGDASLSPRPESHV